MDKNVTNIIIIRQKSYKNKQNQKQKKDDNNMSKNRKKDWKVYIWTIPLLWAILTLIGILTPTTYRNSWGVEAYFWIWGYVYSYEPGLGTQSRFFDFAYEVFYPSLICFSILAIILIALFIVLIKEKRHPGTSGGSIALLGILLIVLIIGYAISMQVGYPIYFKRAFPADWATMQSMGMDINFWRTNRPNFGIIGPILGGICAIIGGTISKYSDKIDEKVISKELLKPKEETQMDEEIKIREKP